MVAVLRRILLKHPAFAATKDSNFRELLFIFIVRGFAFLSSKLCCGGI